MTDDDEPIASLAGGDDTALRRLFDRHAPWLAVRLRKALSPDDVKDVLQETFLAVWGNAGTYRPQGRPAAWLWVIALNQAASDLGRSHVLAGPRPALAAAHRQQPNRDLPHVSRKKRGHALTAIFGNRSRIELDAPAAETSKPQINRQQAKRHWLLPRARRPARQGHPRIADPRGISRMEKAH